MGSYSFYYIVKNKIQKSKDAELPEDIAALDYATMLSNDGEIVVWQGERFVARVKKANAPLTEDDHTGG